jgi:nitroimidazol reductase NimA-like FMN-containing flavoprotein (pyridoxamine 5'-phosphate oxidase superfamily)
MPKQWISDRAEMEDILRECLAGSLATVGPDGAPYVVTVNYVYRDGKIYFHGAPAGKKMDNLTHDPRVCFAAHVVDRIVRAPRAMEFSTRYRSVVVHGQARRLADPAAKEAALIALTARYAEGQPFEPPTEEDIAATAVVEIEIHEMTGKRNVDR